MGDARETLQPTILVRAAAFEALLADGRDSFTEADLEAALAWLAEPARSATLQALRRSGWLASDPAGTWRPTDLGIQIHDALRAAAEAGLPYQGLLAGLTPDLIVRALLGRGLEELAAAGRESLVPVLSAVPLLTTSTVIQAAETHALRGKPKPERDQR